jgi:predicted nucleotidyltransferase
VDLTARPQFLDLGGLLYDLQELLKTDVDVITENGLRPRIKMKILNEAGAL